MNTDMPDLRLDRRPLYIQTHDRVLALIRDAGLREGDPLPSEARLASRLGISRATLREGLRLLQEEGVIVRRQGLGTFVASATPVLESGLEVLESLESMARRIGLETEVAHLSVVERPPTSEESAGLLLPEGDSQPVLAVSRVILVRAEPVAYLVDIVPCQYLRRSDLEQGFHGSVLEILLKRGEPVLAYSRTEIMAQEAGAALASRLGVRRGKALLKLVAQLFSQDERVVDYSTSFFVPGHFKFQVVRKVGRG